jgi:hypothetical protein
MRAKAVVVLAATGALALSLCGPATASTATQARPDQYRTRAGQQVRGDVLANDSRDLTTVTSHTAPAHGTLALRPDGSFRYSPQAGFTGTDTFTYTTTNAVRLYREDVPPLAAIGGVTLTGGAYGSSLTPVPGRADEFYGLTDRGPNVDGPNGSKVEPLPDFVPAIGRFRLGRDGTAHLLRRIPLRAADGTPYNGQVNCAASTGETITDLNGAVLPCTSTGYDPEGIVALRDGTFWVSDEYGPFITHFDRRGRQLERLSPFDATLPGEFALRVPNRGMEGLTVTPDGRTLVGIMQSALQTPDLTKNPKNVTTLRIVTVDLRSRHTHEYLYLLNDPDSTGTAASEITALSSTRFLVDERDGKVEPGAVKDLFEIDLAGATDVGPATRAGEYDPSRGGLLVGGHSIEALVGKHDTAEATADLAAAGITPVGKRLSLDLGALVSSLDPTGGFFGHDKIEGVAAVNGGRTLVISNDSDFGIDALANDTPPFALHQKTLPDGQTDDGELLAVDLTALPARTHTATVTITVRP